MSTTNITEVANYLKQHVAFTRFAKLTHALGNQLNDKQLRFLKARILEKSLEIYSSGYLKYVATNGCDFLLTNLNDTRLEMKFSENGIFGKRGKMTPNTSIILMNSMGSNTYKKLPDDYADFLLYVTKYGAIVFDKPTISRHISTNGDGITARLPTSLGTVVADFTSLTESGYEHRDFVQALDSAIESYARYIS
jgi:hypothetical protein